MMRPMTTRINAPRIVPRIMKRFLVDRLIPWELDVVGEGAAVEAVGDASGLAGDKDEVTVDDAAEVVVAEEVADEDVVVVDEVEGESIELSSESPISSSCSKLVLLVVAAAVVVAVVFWANDPMVAQNSTITTT
jgi:hypothetical protein